MDPLFAIPVILALALTPLIDDIGFTSMIGLIVFALEAYVIASSRDSVTSAGRTIMLAALAALAAYGAVLGVSIAKSGKNRP